MAFGAAELRVLRRALALALHPGPASAEDVQDCLRLAESLDEAMSESTRLRAFLLADLARYRAALPGTAAGYFTLLEEALGAGYRPEPDDLAALRALRGNPVAAVLLDRCRLLAEQDVRARLVRGRRRPADAADAVTVTVPASRTRLLAIPGGREPLAASEPGTAEGAEKSPRKAPGGQPAQSPGQPPSRSPEHKPGEKPAPKPAPKPAEKPADKPADKPAERPSRPAPAPQPSRPVPTPGEVFPRRKPTPPSQGAPRQLAVG
ncbi:hypothetical protein [Streptomyces sp. YIM S03343]